MYVIILITMQERNYNAFVYVLKNFLKLNQFLQASNILDCSFKMMIYISMLSFIMNAKLFFFNIYLRRNGLADLRKIKFKK